MPTSARQDLIRIKLYLIYKLHDFLVIMGKLPDPALHLRNKISDTHHHIFAIVYVG